MRNCLSHDHPYCSISLTPSILRQATSPQSLIYQLSTTFPVSATVTIQRFCIEETAHDDHLVQFYTSFASYSQFMICFTFLGKAAHHLDYPGQTTTGGNGDSPRRAISGRDRGQRILTAKNEFFLTLCRLRCGLMEQDLAFRFKISQSTV